MNVNKNKSISKGFIFSKTIFPAVGALLLATQMTGCTGMSGRLGQGEDLSSYSNKTANRAGNNQNKSLIMRNVPNQIASTCKKINETKNPTDQALEKPEFSRINFPKANPGDSLTKEHINTVNIIFNHLVNSNTKLNHNKKKKKYLKVSFQEKVTTHYFDD